MHYLAKYGQFYYSILIENIDQYRISSEYGPITEIQIVYKNA